MRRRSRTDSNQPAIVKIFRSLGCSVQHLHTVGQGCPDILVGKLGVNLMVEIKDGSRGPSDRKLTIDEMNWHKEWSGQVCVIESDQDAIDLIAGLNR